MRVIGLGNFYRLFFTFFLNKKSNKKVKDKRKAPPVCPANAPFPFHLTMLIQLFVVIETRLQETASCFSKTLKALLFR